MLFNNTDHVDLVIVLLLLERRVNGPATGKTLSKKVTEVHKCHKTSLLYENDKATGREIFFHLTFYIINLLLECYKVK